MAISPIPAPQAPKSGWKRVLLGIIGVLAVVILVPVAGIFLFLFALSHSMDEMGKKASAADDLEQLLHPGYQIGAVVPVGDLRPDPGQAFTLQVTSFSCGSVIGSAGTPIAGGPFCTVAVTMVNTSTQDRVFDLPQYLEGVRGDGTSLRVNPAATSAANRDPKPYTQSVSPGQSIKARLLYDAPAASRPIVAIVLQPFKLTEYQAGVDFTLTDEERKRQPPMETAVPWHAPVPTQDPLPSDPPPYTPMPMDPPEPRKAPVPTYDPTLPRMGEAVSVGGATFVVSAFQCEPALRFPVSRDLIPAFGHYCAVTVTLTNHTRTIQTFGFHRIEGYLAKKPYPFDIMASEDAAGDKGIFFEEIKSNESLKKVVLFDMPKGFRLDTVKLVGFNGAASSSVQLR